MKGFPSARGKQERGVQSPGAGVSRFFGASVSLLGCKVFPCSLGRKGSGPRGTSGSIPNTLSVSKPALGGFFFRQEEAHDTLLMKQTQRGPQGPANRCTGRGREPSTVAGAAGRLSPIRGVQTGAGFGNGHSLGGEWLWCF